MKRIYDDECKKALERFFENCAKAVRKNVIADPGSMGEVACLMRRFVAWTEGLNGQDEASSMEWFDHTERYAGFPAEMSEILFRKTGIVFDADAHAEVDHPAGDHYDASQESIDDQGCEAIGRGVVSIVAEADGKRTHAGDDQAGDHQESNFAILPA